MLLGVMALFSLAVGLSVWSFLTNAKQGKRFQERLEFITPPKMNHDQVLKPSHPTHQKFHIENIFFFAAPILVAILLQRWLPASGPLAQKIALALAFSLAIKIFWKSYKIRRYRQQIEEALPGTLDLLVVCVEAGMSLAASLVRLAEETKGSPLSNELRYTFYEINVGLPTEDAFRNLARRTKVPDVSAFVTTIIESEKMGMRLGESLRNHAGILRETIRMRTRERIQKLPVKMLFPLAFFIMPAIFMIVLAPSFLKLAPVFESLRR